MSLNLSPSPYLTVDNPDGSPSSGALIYTYAAGSSTPIVTYTDALGLFPNENPVEADASGRYVIYLNPGTGYKYVITAADGTPLWEQDNILGVPSTSAIDIDIVAGEALTAGQPAYLSDGSGGKMAGLWYRGDNANPYSSTTPEVGMVTANIANGGSGTIRTNGRFVGLSGLVTGAYYYIGTVGTLTGTPPTNLRVTGQADSSTSLIMGAPVNVIVPYNFGGTGLSAVPANGQIPIGNGAGYALNTLTAGNGLTITNTAGVITISPSVTLLDRSTTEQAVTNSTTPTSIYAFSVVGGILSTNRTLRLTITGRYTNTSGGNSTAAFTGTYGGTTFIANTAFRNFSTATTGGIKLTILINANGAANSQRVQSSLEHITDATLPGNTVFGASTTLTSVQNGMAEDSTAAKTLTILWTHGTADLLITYTRFDALLELIG